MAAQSSLTPNLLTLVVRKLLGAYPSDVAVRFTRFSSNVEYRIIRADEGLRVRGLAAGDASPGYHSSRANIQDDEPEFARSRAQG
jgi:hypothetical protein